MQYIRTITAVLSYACLCLADISGTVTDTGGTPVGGAVVKLEAGGQTATTDYYGNFTLYLTVPVNTSGTQFSLSKIYATLQNNVLQLDAAERADIAITVYNIEGKALLSRKKIIESGTSALSLPRFGSGVYLYRLKSGKSELIIKSGSVEAKAGALLSGGSNNGTVVKAVAATSSFDDVINIQRAGYLNYREELTDPDTNGIVINMIDCHDSVTDVDGNIYQAVRLGNQIWTAENLRTTRYNDSTGIQQATDSAEWASCTTGVYSIYKNDTSYKKYYGALYSWYAVNAGKLAPKGWHVPSAAEWDTLRDCMIAKGYAADSATTNYKIAYALAAKLEWVLAPCTGCCGDNIHHNNRSGFSALPSGYRIGYNSFTSAHFECRWWTSTAIDTAPAAAYNRELNYYDWILGRNTNTILKKYNFSIRLVKDLP